MHFLEVPCDRKTRKNFEIMRVTTSDIPSTLRTTQLSPRFHVGVNRPFSRCLRQLKTCMTLPLCKCQKWREYVKFHKCRKFGDLIMKIVELGKFSKTENLTEIVSKFCVGRALMPRSHANSHTFSFRISGYFLFLKTSLVLQFSILNPQIFDTY